MANTYHQLQIHFVFAVKGRQNLINATTKILLEKIICALVTEKKCKPLAVYCNPDHTHLFVGLSPELSCSQLMQFVKSNSSRLMKKNRHASSFEWQTGYGAFSVGKKDEKHVIRYILNQEEHHKQRSFKDDFLEFLEDNMIDFRQEYMFEFYTE